MMNKNESTARILSLGKVRNCTKLALDNIMFPAWDELGLLGQLVRQCVVTKEQPAGYIYPEAEFRMVMRILNGKLFMNARPDVYCWKANKVAKAVKNAKIIGTNSAEGLVNLSEVMATIPDEGEKKSFAGMMANLKRDLLLVHTPAEARTCIVVTQELYDAGVTACVDSWVEPDADGNGPETKLHVGDVLIIEHKPEGDFVYRVGRDEFDETHRFDD